MDSSPNLLVAIGPRRIRCENGDDRSLLVQAKAIADKPQVAQDVSVGRLMLVKDACQKYSLGKLQRIVKRAIDTFGK
jgi:hypothetical protein